MLFIYVVLSLFIAIIMDTYENIKEYYKVWNYSYIVCKIDHHYIEIAMANHILLPKFHRKVSLVQELMIFTRQYNLILIRIYSSMVANQVSYTTVGQN